MTHTGKETKLANIYFFIWKKLSAAEKEKKELASTYVIYKKKIRYVQWIKQVIYLQVFVICGTSFS